MGAADPPFPRFRRLYATPPRALALAPLPPPPLNLLPTAGMEIHIIDTDPFSMSRAGGLEDESQVVQLPTPCPPPPTSAVPSALMLCPCSARAQPMLCPCCGPCPAHLGKTPPPTHKLVARPALIFQPAALSSKPSPSSPPPTTRNSPSPTRHHHHHQIAKYRMSEEEYEKRQGTVRSWIKEQKAKDPNWQPPKPNMMNGNPWVKVCARVCDSGALFLFLLLILGL